MYKNGSQESLEASAWIVVYRVCLASFCLISSELIQGLENY